MGSSRDFDAARDFFRVVAKSWSRNYQDGGTMGDRISRFASVLAARVAPGAAVLDFGCGSGEIARHLAARGWRVAGADITPEMLAAAHALDRDGSVAWHLVEADRPLPFAPGSFDAVIASSVLEYAAYPDLTIAALARLLRAGGCLIVSVPDPRDRLRRREGRRRALLRMPGAAWLARRTRWAEGAQYLKVSRNRFPLPRWSRLLAAAGLAPEPVGSCQGPLAILIARKS